MDDIKHDFSELKNFIKIEKIEQSLDSEMTDKNYIYETSNLSLAEQTRVPKSEEHSMPMMDDLKQDFTNDLCEVIKNEKIESSLHLDRSEYSFIGQSCESILSEQKINLNPCMTYNQDKPRNSPHKDAYASNENGTFKLKELKSYTTLRRHELAHSGEKPFKCQICQKGFTHSRYLRNHKITHSGEKPFECQICQKRFYHSSGLKQHELIHSGQKQFKCRICQKRFTHSSHLKNHEIIHSGKKPYQCHICQKRFTQSSSLKDHKKNHSDKKPFQCQICQKGFTRSRSLLVCGEIGIATVVIVQPHNYNDAMTK
ncbi:zinc finger protein 155 [Biomphalaria pfeifferi]|uniref:Zinc finger protein 155 n=1 Tax=Biomphalaria pfeifferi TaxID=112525 RepID=A0AAD8C5G9_BIOPF|nr:zinc finger protein 155 [Biomphalaria pfeifferi]